MNKRSSKYLVLAIGILLIILIGVINFSSTIPKYQSLDPDELQSLVVETRDYGIQKAKENGEYRCCINPPCTMCYMEANQWNNQQAGTCACDDLIAKGEEPCPQCADALSCDSKEGDQESLKKCSAF